MATDKASRKMNVHRGQLCLCVFVDTETMQFKTLLHTYFHIFPYLTCAKIFHLPACSDCYGFSFSVFLHTVWICHIAVILHSLFTGKFLSHLKRGTVTKSSIILHCVFCLNVTQWLLCCCVHSHTTHWLAALQIVSASSYPISAVREIHFEGFYYSTVGFFSSAWPAFGTVVYNSPRPFSAYWQDISTNTFINHNSTAEFQTIAHQIRHWLCRRESGHPSIKWGAAEKVTEAFVCLRSNRRWINSVKRKVKNAAAKLVFEVWDAYVSSSLCTYQTDVRLFQPHPLHHMSFTSHSDPKMNHWRGVCMSYLTDSTEPL